MEQGFSTGLALVGIKLLHTVVWVFFAGCIVAIPVVGLQRRFRWAVWLSAIVFVECLVLAVHGGRCPLTDVAARYTAERAANFDIYLPVWLAARNKIIFGTLFLASDLLVLELWLASIIPLSGRGRSPRGVPAPHDPSPPHPPQPRTYSAGSPSPLPREMRALAHPRSGG